MGEDQWSWGVRAPLFLHHRDLRAEPFEGVGTDLREQAERASHVLPRRAVGGEGGTGCPRNRTSAACPSRPRCRSARTARSRARLAEVVIRRDLFADILRHIDRLRPPPAPA